MMYKIKAMGLSLLIILTLILAGCNLTQTQPTEETATQDIEALKTEIAATVIANITVQAALNPSPTPTMTLSTATPTPTITFTQPATAATPLPTSTKKASYSPPSGGGGAPSPTSDYTDSCAVVSTQPRDYTVVDPGWDFDGIVTVKNTGTRPWNTQFYFKPLSSTIEIDNSIIMLANDVPKGDEYTVRIDMQAPLQPGVYVSNWGVINDDGTVFCQFFIAVEVK